LVQLKDILMGLKEEKYMEVLKEIMMRVPL
jgi:hypothetical protein